MFLLPDLIFDTFVNKSKKVDFPLPVSPIIAIFSFCLISILRLLNNSLFS